MKTKFYYRDNWIGERKEFTTLKAAKTAAKHEDGISITIFRESGNIAEIVKANGYTYP